MVYAPSVVKANVAEMPHYLLLMWDLILRRGRTTCAWIASPKHAAVIHQISRNALQHSKVIHRPLLSKSLSLNWYSVMSLKRKRSNSAVSPSTSSGTASSRDPSCSPSPDIYMLNSTSCPPPPVRQPDTDSRHLHSRTRKRFRDNRPDENTIHGTPASP